MRAGQPACSRSGLWGCWVSDAQSSPSSPWKGDRENDLQHLYLGAAVVSPMLLPLNTLPHGDGVRQDLPLMQQPESKLRSTSRSERILLKNTSPCSVDNNKDKLGQTSIMCVGSNVSSYSYMHLKLKNFPLYLTHKNHFTIFTTEWPHLLFLFFSF